MFVRVIGGDAAGVGKLGHPRCMRVNGQLLFVSSSRRHCISVLTSGLAFVREFGSESKGQGSSSVLMACALTATMCMSAMIDHNQRESAGADEGGRVSSVRW